MNNKNMTPQTYNLHTHTYRCKHAEGDVPDYAEEAAAVSLKTLGFTEHPPLLPEGIWTPFRMAPEDIEGYFQAIASSRESFPELEILAGFEIDLYPRYKTYYEDIILCREETDYVIGGVHWIEYRGEWYYVKHADTAGHLRVYFEEILNLMESGICSFIAHPDSFAAGYHKWDENAEACAHDILSAAEEFNIALEINGYGLRKPEIETPEGPRRMYPLLRFWEKAAEYDIKVICNSDAHKPGDVIKSVDECRDIADRFGLKIQPIQQVPVDIFSYNTALNR